MWIAAKCGMLLTQQTAIDRQKMALSQQTEINRRAQAAAEAGLRAAIAFRRTDAFPASGRALLTQSRQLLASSRALLAQSRQLLTELERADPLRIPRGESPRESAVVSRLVGTPVEPAVHQSEQTPVQHTHLSIRVFKNGEQFGWTVYSPTKELLGRGTAESELSARVDVLQAGMTYIDRLKGRAAPTNTPLH